MERDHHRERVDDVKPFRQGCSAHLAEDRHHADMTSRDALKGTADEDEKEDAAHDSDVQLPVLEE